MTELAKSRGWAHNEFGGAQLGHAARTQRLVAMAAEAARAPAGKVSRVYASDAERQGAYDFLEESSVSPEALTAACVAATVERCAEYPFVFVPVDGSSLTFTDPAHKKELGAIGARSKGARGLKVMTAYATDPFGVPLGVTAQSWWARTNKPAKGRTKRVRNAKRETKDKETQRWIDVIAATVHVLDAQGTRAWFQLDREGDSAPVLKTLVKSGHWFTVRSSADRRLAGTPIEYLRQRLPRQRVLGSYALPVCAGLRRTPRLATMRVRAVKVELRLRHPWTKTVTTIVLTAVWARETSTTPAKEKPIDWLLFTNHDVLTFEDARAVVRGYATRWRIEELHKAWKSGACCVEEAQLYSQFALIKWATILLAVATRIERLKLLARQSPELPASLELRPTELLALVLLKRKQKKRTETISDHPCIADAVRWMADLGGYTGKSSGGPPGTITIGRGLHNVMIAAATIEAFSEKDRRK